MIARREMSNSSSRMVSAGAPSTGQAKRPGPCSRNSRRRLDARFDLRTPEVTGIFRLVEENT
jgi:hypothetical protein